MIMLGTLGEFELGTAAAASAPEHMQTLVSFVRNAATQARCEEACWEPQGSLNWMLLLLHLHWIYVNIDQC